MSLAVLAAEPSGPRPAKYTGGAYHDIAASLTSGVPFDFAIEFVRRLTAITGNGDMPLKNWSLLYPEDGRTPMPSPVYDMLSSPIHSKRRGWP